MEPLLTVRDLRVWFDVRVGAVAAAMGKRKHVRAVDGISFDVRRGEVFCLVGESGCGKTTTGKALLRLNEPTQGSIFFEAPPEQWDRFVAREQRLAELQPTLAHLSAADRNRAVRNWFRLRKLARRLDDVQNPKDAARLQSRRKRVEMTIEVLDVREKALREGDDPALIRTLAKDRERIEVLQELGPRFTPRQARLLERLEARLKEARFNLMRAEATHAGVRRWARAARRLERRIQRMRRHVRPGEPETQTKVAELQAALETRKKQLTDLELQRVESERNADRARLDSLRAPESPGAAIEIQGLGTEMAEIRARGGSAFEALELRALVDEFRDRFDVATWGRKAGLQLRRQRGRWKLLKQRMRGLRRRMQIIYQDPYESLNPKLSIFDIVAEPLLANRVVATTSEAEAVVAKALEDVGLRPASEYMFRYPHELSGGQRQRVGIATALVVDPDFIVADEPVSMLDASVRTEILALLLELKKGRDLTYLFITHDLGLAWILADRIAVMYLGKIVETGDGAEIIQNPRHPYTKALISVVPSPNPSVHREKIILRGERPDPVDIPGGCRFHPRCPMAVGICGWGSEEVRQELEKLLQEDHEAFPEARAVTDVAVTGPFALTLSTSESAQVEKYLRKRLQAVALGRPALGAIRGATAGASTLELTLHQAVEPPLRRIKGDIWVACHLVEPEIAESEMAQPDAAVVAG